MPSFPKIPSLSPHQFLNVPTLGNAISLHFDPAEISPLARYCEISLVTLQLQLLLLRVSMVVKINGLVCFKLETVELGQLVPLSCVLIFIPLYMNGRGLCFSRVDFDFEDLGLIDLSRDQ